MQSGACAPWFFYKNLWIMYRKEVAFPRASLILKWSPELLKTSENISKSKLARLSVSQTCCSGVNSVYTVLVASSNLSSSSVTIVLPRLMFLAPFIPNSWEAWSMLCDRRRFRLPSIIISFFFLRRLTAKSSLLRRGSTSCTCMNLDCSGVAYKA